MRTMLIALALIAETTAQAEPIKIRITMPDGTVANEQIANTNRVAFEVARLEAIKGTNAVTLAEIKAREVRDRTVELAKWWEQEVERVEVERIASEKKSAREARNAGKQD